MRSFIIALAAIGGAGPALAQDRLAEERPTSEGWGLVLGGGGLASSSYEGDDSYRLSLLPNIQVSYGDVFFASVQEGIGYRVLNTETLRAGPILRVKFSRDEDGSQPFAVTGSDTRDLIGLGEVDTSLELGGFVEFDAGPLRFGAEARQAATGHEGFVANLDARFRGTLRGGGPPLIWSVGPRVKLVDDDYIGAYFGVTAAQSLASGLPRYQAGGGLYSYGIGATAILPLTREMGWTAVLVAGVDRLTGDAADSPLVQLRGTETQASLGIFLSRQVF
jgi:outer membrane protein